MTQYILGLRLVLLGQEEQMLGYVASLGGDKPCLYLNAREVV